MPPEAPEFSRPLALGRVGPEGRAETLEAGPAERAALARRFGIPGIDSLRVRFDLQPEADGAIRATGELEAEVVQECVVSLEPVPQRVAERFVLRLLPAGREPGDGPEDLDEIETEHDVADLGEVAAEQLALALDPYPRAPDAVLPAEAGSAEGAFAALAALRRRPAP
ncbi:YceD family protein [Roseicella frigidaeris]|uniref:DUF177 domain-containing protein n=1 Tax=Roseicella frigidaeris TaxID=2230885 RepID=A0A327MDK1_9PROT|nr:DUF177 domain-containing protein [Roseicella frigidaeris]RAI60133.1 DUF177 domain-containing protein [Roseicella frigidaeris]